MKNRNDDPIFQDLVEILYDAMEKVGYSLTDMIEAATVAAIRYEIAHKDDPQNRF